MHVVILGNGISGVTAARWIRKLSDHQITIISSESQYFYSRTALMYIYMGHMRFEDTKPYEDWFWAKNRIDLVFDHVNEIDFEKKELKCNSGEEIKYDKLVLAVGSESNKFGWPGQDLNRVRGLYSLQDLEYLESCTKSMNRAVIVGGGLIGIELAEMLLSRRIPVTMLVREEYYWDNILPKEEARMISRHIRRHGIDLRLQSNLKEIHDDGSGNACGITIAESGERISCEYVGLTPGVSPNVRWLKESGLNINRGILVNQYLETNINDVYAVGDCAELTNPVEGRRGIEAIWYTGRMMGETCAYNVCNQVRSYDPGIWFNSAKFLDIEYQVYGEIPNQLPGAHKTFYWEHPDGEKSLRINYHDRDFHIIGFNLMGIRFRHEVCEKWIADQLPIEEVMSNLALAHFDPEFYDAHYRDIVKSFESQSNMSIEFNGRVNLNRVLQFLNS